MTLRKMDLHIHTPRSTCYRHMSATVEQIVDAAIAAGLDAIAVTDHNAVDGAEHVRQVAANRGLDVFPGVEISAREGHVLALFDTDAPLGRLVDFLDHIGIDRQSHGDGSALARDGMVGVFRKTVEFGGIAIAAHIERSPTGFLEARESHEVKAAIHASADLSALEITMPQNKRQWNEGLVSGYRRQIACLQSSDAHSPAEVCRRPVYIDMPQMTLAALRAAFLDFSTRIRFPDELDVSVREEDAP